MKDLSELDLWDQPDEGDPLVWLRKYRDEMAEKYPTPGELSAYFKTVPSASEMLRELKQKIEEKRRKGYQSTDFYAGEDADPQMPAEIHHSSSPTER